MDEKGRDAASSRLMGKSTLFSEGKMGQETEKTK
jgi:hypothetical protein